MGVSWEDIEMQQFVAYLLVAWQWVQANPWLTMFFAYTLVNVLYAQLPRPKDERLAWAWDKLHWALGLIVTHKTEIGTFQWPKLILWLLASVQKSNDNEPKA